MEHLKPRDLEDGVLYLSVVAFERLSRLDSELFSSFSHLILGGSGYNPAVVEEVAEAFPLCRISFCCTLPESLVPIAFYRQLPRRALGISHSDGRVYSVNYGASIPVGRLGGCFRVFILDALGSHAPAGAIGELCLAGPAISSDRYASSESCGSSDDCRDGDWQWPQSNLRPPACEHGEPLVYTGRLASWTPEGELALFGRIPTREENVQYELESVLLEQLPLLSVAFVQPDNDGQPLLYLQASNPVDDKDSFSKSVRRVLRSQPWLYILPADIIFLGDNAPRNHEGSLDRSRLPKVLPEPLDYIAPRTATEHLLASIWSELLPLAKEEISCDSNFFALGGHSLLLTRLLAKLREQGLYTDIRSVFNAPTLAALAAVLDQVGQKLAEFTAPPNLIPPRCEHITPQMLSLLDLSTREINAITATVSGGAANIQDIYPLAPLQEGIYFHHSLEGGKDPYVLQMLLSVASETQLNAFVNALQTVVERHDVLRTAIVMEGLSVPVQVVYRRAPLVTKAFQLSPGGDLQKEFINRVAQTPAMDMSQAPLLHLYTTRDPGGSRYLMSLNLHHIIIDHVGMEQVLQEIGALLTSDHARLPAPVPYRTFVALALHQRRTSAAQDFFSEQLSDVKHTCAPFGLVNVYSDGQRVDVANQPLSRDLSKALRGLARAQKISCATLFHAAWAMVVGVCANCEDVVFGTVVSGRLQSLQDGDRALGLFINTLPLRIVLFGKNVAQLLEDTDSALHQLLSYEQTPLSLAQGCSGLSGGKPLFSAILNYRHSSIEAAEDGDDITDFGITPLSLQERSNYPLNISVNDYGEDFSLDALVDSSVSAQKVLNYFVTAISRLVDAVNAHDDSPVTQFTLLPNEEKYQLLQQWSSAARWSHSYFSKRKTIEGRKVYVLDQHLRPTPVSVAGELYIDVKASADGECHSEDWLENPYTTDKDSHLYGTGDQVRWLETGELQWLGRSPRQRRRDCQSLTSLICHYAGVREAFVLDHGTVYAQPYAYVVPGEEGSAISPAGLRDYIRCQAPLYPLPVQIVVSDKLPLTEDGSSDPSAISPSDRHETGAVDYVAPETGEEKLLVELWAQLLPYEQEDIGIEADFFALGGQSLLATMLVNLIKQRTGIALPLRTVFERPTLRMLAHELATQPVNSHAMPITPVERNRHIPLSFAQQRMWFLAKLEGVNAHYNIPMALRLSGTLNQDVLIAALRKIIQRHEVLRTHFEEDAGRAFQCIDRCDDFVIEKQWIEREELVTLCEREASMPFDLSTGPLLRARLLILSAREHVLIMTVHHSVADGWSMTIFFQELVALYQAIKEKAAIPLAPQRVQYADYAHWQRQWLTEAVLQQQRDYWLQKLANLPVFSGLPTDYPHPEKKTYRGAHQPLNFSRQLMDRLNTLSLEYGVTLNMTLLAAFALLVSRYSHQTDVVIGTPVANRNHPGTEELIGLFVNTLVMRSDLSGNPLFSTLLKQVKETALDAYANQDIPFEHLVESFRSERSQRYSPLFQVAFALQNIPSHQHRLDDLEFSSVDFAVSIAKFDLTLNLHETATGLQGSMEYNTDLFTPATVTTLIARYEHLLTVIVDRPEEKIGALSCLSDADLDQIAEDWRHSLCTAATDVSLCELFEIRVAQSPQVPAFIYNKSVCNYGQLNARANQLAHYLLQHSLPGESIIGLCLRNWINLTVAKLGMLKANFAYVIIDPQDCSTRQRYIINDCNIALLLTETGIGIEGLAGDRHIVYFDSERDNRGADELLCGQPVTNLTRCKSALHFESLACVTYPCGPSPFKSGERPVGVAVQQKNIISAIVAGNVNEGDIIAVDVRVGLASIDLELWGALLRGASVTQWDRQQLLSVSSAETSWSDANVIFADIRSMLLGVARDSFLSNSVNRVYLTGESVHESELAKMVKTNSEIEFYYLRSPMECYRLTALSPAAANADKPLLSCALSCSGKLSACVLHLSRL
ncbi:MAG: condensation domain-containing protein [Exilibacterium sp.]